MKRILVHPRTSGDLLSIDYGTLYPALLKLEQEGFVASEWGASENNRRAKFYRLTKAGRRQLGAETEDWRRISVAISGLRGSSHKSLLSSKGGLFCPTSPSYVIVSIVRWLTLAY